MKLKHLGIFLLLSTMAVFSACSDDDDDNGGVDLAQEIKGDYFGTLDVTVSGNVAEPTSNIINATAIAKNEIQLDLKEFTYVEGGIEIKIRDIKLEKIKLEGKEGDIKLTKNTQTINISVAGAPIEAEVTTNGTVKGKKMSLVLDIDAAGLPIEVKFIDGDLLGEVASILYDMEEWAVEEGYENGQEIPKGWASSNEGSAFALAAGKPGVTKAETENIYKGTQSVKMETVRGKETPGLEKHVPLVTAGSLFTGRFDFDMMAGLAGKALEMTKFGIPLPFEGKPLTLSGYYKYKAGMPFLRVPEGGEIGKPTPTDEKDQCAINAILYEITSDADDFITGKDTYLDPRIVATVMLTSGDTSGDKYHEFSKNFEYKAGKTYDPSKKYRLAIITSSSADGNNYNGAIGSTLYVDDIKVTYEK